MELKSNLQRLCTLILLAGFYLSAAAQLQSRKLNDFFEIKIPATATASKPPGSPEGIALLSKDGEVRFLAMTRRASLSPAELKNDLDKSEFLQGSARGAANNINGDILRGADTSLSGQPGHLVYFDDNTYKSQGRVTRYMLFTFLGGADLYMLTFSAPLEKWDEFAAVRQEFFGGIRQLKEPQLPPAEKKENRKISHANTESDRYTTKLISLAIAVPLLLLGLWFVIRYSANVKIRE